MNHNQQNGFEGQKNSQANYQLNSMLNIFGINFNARPGSLPLGMLPQAMFGHQITCNQQNQSIASRSIQNEKIQVLEKKGSIQSSEHLETHKKLKLPRCSLCLKKINYSDLFRCQKCQKTYHIACTNCGDVCFRCLHKEKKKEEKKELKIQKKLQKANSFPTKKNDTNLEIDSDMDENQKKRIMFLKSYPFYINGDSIQYPVEDSLFDQYQDVLIPQIRGQRPPSIPLSKHFGSLMEIWNIMITFPHFFEVNSNFSIQDLEKNLICQKMPKNMEASLLKFMHFHLRDSTWENLEQYRENNYFPFLSLLRFCSQSGFLDRIFVFAWPKFLKCCFDLQILSSLDCEQFIKIQNKIEQKYINGEHEIFNKIEQRLTFLSLLCKTIVDTNSFRSFLNEKSDYEKVNNKQKNQLIQLKKQQENKLSAIKDQLKFIIKEKRKVAKILKKRQSQEQDKFEQLEHKEKMLEEAKENVLENIKEIDIQVQTMNSSFSGFSNIWLIGRDKNRNNYWFTLDQKDKIIVQTSSQQWSFYSLQNINPFLKSLNLKGIRQNQLFHSLKEYQKLLENSNFQQVVSEENEKQQQNKGTQIQDSKFVYSQLEGINLNSIKLMIAESERKMTKYLEQRNARWGNQVERKSFLQKMLKQFTEVSQFLPELKFFNERICVVQIQYKIILEDSAEQIDSKTRKIQTKIWGINQKYKHSWFDFAKSCENISDLFFLVSVLFLNIEKYVSKNRKLRKQYEEVKGPTKYMKTKTAQILDQKWNQYCETCGGNGQLLCCDTCPKVFPLECVGLSQVPQGQYKCKVCMKKRHTRNQIRKFVGE